MSDDQRFAQWLQDYEAERMPDDMNIWNAIESQLKPVRRTTVFPRVGWLVAILILILMTAGVYALDQIINNQVGDEGMNTVAEQGKVAELFITNDFGGEYELQITLETIYADSNRVYVTMSASGTMPADNRINLHLNPRVIIADEETLPFIGFDTELPFLGFGGGGGSGGGNGNTSDRVPFNSSLTMNYDASAIQNIEDSLTLSIVVEIAYQPVQIANLDDMNVLGTTEFLVEVPFNKGITVNPNLSVTGENIEITLQSAVIAPSLTRLELCYVEPAHPETDTLTMTNAWLPIMSLSVDGVTVIESQLIGQLPDTYNPETGCYTYILTFALDSYVGEWTLSIDRLVYQLTPPTDELQQAFDEAGLPATAFENGGYGLDSTGLSDAEFVEISKTIENILGQWQEKIEGAWTFTFRVPEA